MTNESGRLDAGGGGGLRWSDTRRVWAGRESKTEAMWEESWKSFKEMGRARQVG